MTLINPVPQFWQPGSVTRSGGFTSIPAVYPKGGSTRGSSVVTLSGTPSYGLLLQYTVDLTNVMNGQVSSQVGLFAYNRSSATASLADLIAKFANHLARYHDVEITATSATTLTMRSLYWGFTPSLTTQTTSITAANVLTAATPPSTPVPGDMILLTAANTGYVASLVRTANMTATTGYGVVLRRPTRNLIADGRDVVLDVLVSGFAAVECGGTTAKTAATGTLSIFTDGSRPGMFNFGGFSHGATTSATTSASMFSGAPLAPVNIGRQLRAITTDVNPGQVFEMQIQAA
jgi:hypothetical protein